MSNLVVVDHPLVAHKLSLMRDKRRQRPSSGSCCARCRCCLATRCCATCRPSCVDIETPVGPTRAPFLKGKKLVLVPILRAGNGLLDGLLDLVPSARVGHIGLYRDPATLAAVEYYCKLPDDIGDRPVIVVDPMLATGNSAVAAVTRIKARGARDIRLVCLLAAPEGIARVRRVRTRRCRVFTAADRRAPERPRLHRARPGRCRRPHVRDEIRGSRPGLRARVAATARHRDRASRTS